MWPHTSPGPVVSPLYSCRGDNFGVPVVQQSPLLGCTASLGQSWRSVVDPPHWHLVSPCFLLARALSEGWSDAVLCSPAAGTQQLLLQERQSHRTRLGGPDHPSCCREEVLSVG